MVNTDAIVAQLIRATLDGNLTWSQVEDVYICPRARLRVLYADTEITDFLLTSSSYTISKENIRPEYLYLLYTTIRWSNFAWYADWPALKRNVGEGLRKTLKELEK